MKIKNKGKVYPSPSSSSSVPSYSPNRDALSVLKLLPAAILALASVLSLEDREVLAYLITRSMKTTTPSSFTQDSRNKKGKKSLPNSHNPPLFHCGCFDCYRSYWFRWDSSPNRELIHRAIEAFEDHLGNGELSKRNARGKKKDKVGRRVSDKPTDIQGLSGMRAPDSETGMPENFSPELEETCVVLSPENDVSPVFSSDKADGTEGNIEACEEHVAEDANGDLPDEEAVVRSTAASNHKGLARKVLPDVLGLFNSRLWSLWSPNV